MRGAAGPNGEVDGVASGLISGSVTNARNNHVSAHNKWLELSSQAQSTTSASVKRPRGVRTEKKRVTKLPSHKDVTALSQTDMNEKYLKKRNTVQQSHETFISEEDDDDIVKPFKGEGVGSGLITLKRNGKDESLPEPITNALGYSSHKGRTRNAAASQNRRTGAQLRENSRIIENVPSQSTLDFGVQYDASST